ncbi:hypothetical protein CDL12_02165 [Handroanthus impetiginosus]|uniref:PGG domain-containing protein n=1 Tax=Handroanthus impetiginosus TaxID=429701 RepID=A0A2G9I642_9LAMI|nr:hypothetical protein CDL12_02165 [Handroanthus impetiginosus]
MRFVGRLTWAALKAASVPRSWPKNVLGRPPLKNTSSVENYKGRVDTLLVVSTLVATVTFAAGFTVPGGYNSSPDTDLGIATMLREKGFHVFIFCDTIAMYSSIIVVVALIWAQLSDLGLVLNALTLAVPLLGVALGMMSTAFIAGVFLAISKHRWLSIAVLVMGITFLAFLSIIIIPLCITFPSSNRILRYILYYPFCLVILASSRWPMDRPEEWPQAVNTACLCPSPPRCPRCPSPPRCPRCPPPPCCPRQRTWYVFTLCQRTSQRSGHRQ